MKTLSLSFLAGLVWTSVATAQVAGVSIHDGDSPLPEVRVSAPSWRTGEPCPVCLVAPGLLSFERTGPTDQPLTIFFRADGTATPRLDYAPLPPSVEIPAGATRTEVRLMPLDDLLAEGPEVVRVQLLPPPATAIPYQVSNAQKEALVAIYDDEAHAPKARLDLVLPKDGDQFATGAPVELSAIGVYTEGELSQGVGFYDGDRLIGSTPPSPVARPPIPGLPSVHTIRWENPPAGKHTLTAKSQLGLDRSVVSPPVHIGVGDPPPRGVVRIEATHRISEETSFPFRRLRMNGLFTISRTGSTEQAQPVWVHYSGSSTPDKDYPALPLLVSIPVGAAAIEIPVEANVDETPEAIETLVATLSNCPPPPIKAPCYEFDIDPAHSEAIVFLRDDGITEASLDLLRPEQGARFEVGQTIRLEALAIDLESYISHVEFWDGEEQVGVSDIYFIGAPDPGTPILHGFEWTKAAPGPHVLTARTTTLTGDTILSLPVKIEVGPGPNVPVVGIRALVPETREPLCDPAICDGPLPAPGVFLLSRRGGDLSQALSVMIQYAGGAINGTDYESLPGVATFPSGKASVEISVSAKFDQLLEGDEKVVAEVQPDPSLGPVERYRVDPAQATAVVVIHDNNQPPPRPVVSLEIVDAQAAETLETQNNIDWAEFLVRRTGPAAEDLVVFITTREGTAKLGEDYRLDRVTDGSAVRIPAGVSSLVVRLYPIDDAIYEGDEGAVVRVIAPPVGTSIRPYDIDLDHAAVKMVIYDNDPVTTRLEITAPREGQQFKPGDLIELRAQVFGPGSGEAWKVEFFDGEHSLGTTKPGGTIPWSHAAGGPHLINARAYNSAGIPGQETLKAMPVHITVGPGPTWPVVRIEATQRIAEEDSLPFDRLPFQGVFTISRNGPIADSLPVYVRYSGSATSPQDYPTLPWVVTIPAGAATTEIRIVPIPDQVPEGIETLVATISNCPPPWLLPPCYDFGIDPAHESATVFIRDDGLTQSSLVITQPKIKAQFNAGDVIHIEAIAIDLKSYISRVEFWDGEHSIGVSEIVFVRPPDPGTPILHTFEWRGASAGEHVLTARVPRADGTTLLSQPVRIQVGPASADRVVLDIVATDPLAREPGLRQPGDPAVFTVRRTAGPLNIAVTVHYGLEGTAVNGEDYETLPGTLLLRAGERSVDLVIRPLSDVMMEGEETVVAHLSAIPCFSPPPPECYLIGEGHSARAVILDVSPQNQPPKTVLTRPSQNQVFEPGQAVNLRLEAVDPDGYVPRAEFFADGRRIGEQMIEFIRPPEPGQRQVFEFVWENPLPGPHRLTARVTDNQGLTGSAPVVEILVGRTEPLPIVAVLPLDPFAREPGANTLPDTATFGIVRFGPSTEPLEVSYSLGGTAENGADYARLTGRVTFEAGRETARVTVVPLADDHAEGIETLVLRLNESSQYQLAPLRHATAVITDRNLPSPAAHCIALGDGVFYLCFAAESGRRFRIEASTDLRTWESLFEGEAVEDELHFIDDEMKGHPRRFYRLVPEDAGG